MECAHVDRVTIEFYSLYVTICLDQNYVDVHALFSSKSRVREQLFTPITLGKKKI